MGSWNQEAELGKLAKVTGFIKLFYRKKKKQRQQTCISFGVLLSEGF